MKSKALLVTTALSTVVTIPQNVHYFLSSNVESGKFELRILGTDVVYDLSKEEHDRIQALHVKGKK